MRRLVFIAVGLVLCSLPSIAGEFLINEADAYGLRVTFSEPVTITHVEGGFPAVSPEGEATEFTFSGAKLPAWVGHGVIWAPTSARILEYHWLASPPTAPLPADEPSAGDSVAPVVGPDLTPAPLPEPLPAVSDPVTPAEPPGVNFAWADIAYTQSYAQGSDILAGVLLNGTAAAVDRAQHWGLPGSEIKGLKLSYVDEGLFLQLETWDASIHGSYAYAIAFRPLGSNYVPFEIGIDPGDGSVWAATEDGLDLSVHVQLVSLDDGSLVLFIADVLLPGGASVGATDRLWDRVIILYYGAGRTEGYELQDRVDIEP